MDARRQMIGPEHLAKGERAETAGDYLAAAAAYRSVTAVANAELAADAHVRLGRVLWRLGRFDVAMTAFENARALAEKAGATELQARAENGAGAVHYALSDYPSARAAYAASLALTRDRAMKGKIILNLGVIENILGDFEQAREHYEYAYRTFTEEGDNASATLALHNRGMVEADLLRWSAAAASFRAALALATEAGNRDMIAKTLVNQSEVLVAQGALTEAIAQCERALHIYDDLGDELGRGEALRWRALALARAGDHGPAERSAREALQIAVRCGARLLEAEVARDLGDLRRLLGDHEGSHKLLRRALVLFTGLGVEREANALEKQIGPVEDGKDG
jgi:tetratricopeptide (TPR) repeat protein